VFRKKPAIASEIVQLGLLVFLLLAFRSSFADHYHVPSGSMEYTLLPGDRVVVDKTAYGVRLPFTTIDLFGAATPGRGDVVVFDSPRDGERLIKRIVAVAGDVVSLVDGQLAVNGLPLGDAASEDFGAHLALLNLSDGGGPDIDSLAVPEGMVLALGDHRGNSLDGRFFGTIPEKEIVGRALGIYFRRGEGFTWREL
jgi:signal peptidase I